MNAKVAGAVALYLVGVPVLSLVAGGVTAYYVKVYQIEHTCQKGNSP